MKNLKKITVVVLVIGFLVNIGFAKEMKEKNTKKEIKIGLSFGMYHSRWSREHLMMEKYANEIGGVKIIVRAARDNVMKQLEQCMDLINQKVDVLLIVSLDSDASAVIVTEAHKKGVKVIAYDRMINSADLDLYVSFDSIEVGELMAKALVKKYPKGNYVILKGGPTDNNAYLLYKGNMNILDKYIKNGDIKIVSAKWCEDWAPEIGFKNTTEALKEYKNDITAIIAGWDGLANGAHQALINQNLAGKVGLTGQDAQLAACQRIVEGTQTMTVYKPLKILSKLGLESAISLAKGKKLATTPIKNKKGEVPAILAEIYSINETNMNIVIQDGMHKLEDVYHNIPKNKWPIKNNDQK